ncbi:hypothetical protein RP726_01390 [Candidatus Methylospira mobilis]|uniref:hypothetical protein n=1 Tax=Candidatus Methylospira mobilis TaxID=1808979 RepID=UPI0028E7053F|nr:hypothetical protein [Candidatus Methylospira mobilis]WNV05078.1 hypothetical protein RP726_01390 [Candidatus Methylospira mobilis]
MNVANAVIQNSSSFGLYLSSDPNWDGQILLVDGKLLHGGSFLTEPGLSATAGVVWGDSLPTDTMMGIIIEDGAGGSFQLTIGQDPGTQKMTVTDPEPYIYGSPKVNYVTTAQTEWSVTLVFSDN